LSEEPRPKAPADKLLRVLLLDTSAFIMGYEATDVEAEHYTVPLVREELREGDLAELRFDSAVRGGRLKVVTPDPEHLSEVRAVILEMGEAGGLSVTDEQLLALGVQLKFSAPVIVSDDYSVQNVADHLGLRYSSLATLGIRRRFDWIVYCPGCRRSFSELQPGSVCPVCGTELKRKPVRKRPAQRR
jgi:rRNA maturation endonuclease Nob1